MSNEHIENVRTSLSTEIEAARGRRHQVEDQVAHYSAELDTLDGTIKRLTEALNALSDGDEGMAILIASEADPEPTPPTTEPEPALGPDASTSDYLRLVLKENPGKMNAAQAVTLMRARGWDTTSTNPSNLVRSNVTAMVKIGQLRRVGAEGSGYFALATGKKK